MNRKVLGGIGVVVALAAGGAIYAASGSDEGSPKAAIGSTAPKTELLKDGGFEDTELDPLGYDGWGVSGQADTFGGVRAAHTGAQALKIGDVVGEETSGMGYQRVTIPSNATTAELSFWLRCDQPEFGGTLYVEVTSSRGGPVLQQMATFHNLQEPRFTYLQRSGFAYRTALINLAAFHGRSVFLQFRSATSAVPASNGGTRWWIDDVTLQTSSTTTPNLNVSPTSQMTFSATAGGANPATQQLSIQNTVLNAAMSFTVADNASWLTVTPTSGTITPTGQFGPVARATVTAHVAGLARGTYRGNITVTAATATNSPSTVPVTLVVN